VGSFCRTATGLVSCTPAAFGLPTSISGTSYDCICRGGTCPFSPFARFIYSLCGCYQRLVHLITPMLTFLDLRRNGPMYWAQAMQRQRDMRQHGVWVQLYM
jgi:hypothetical protein